MLRIGKYRTLGLAGLIAAVAMLAVASVGAASASAAEPEFWHCVKSAKGLDEYPTLTDCINGTKFGEEPREWDRAKVAAGSKIAFTSTSGVKELTGGFGTFKVVCKKDKNAGEIIGPKHVTFTVTFEECEASGGECQNQGAGTKTIKTELLKGWLYYIKAAAPTEVGIFLTANAGTVFAKFTCANTFPKEVTVESTAKAEYEPGGAYKNGKCIAGKIEPINKMATSGNLIIKAAGGKQAIKEVNYEGHKFECELTANGFASQENEVEPPGDVITFAEDIEIKA